MFPIIKGHVLSEEDLVIRKHILNLMCRYETKLGNEIYKFPALSEGFHRCEELQQDGLVELTFCKIKVTEKGMAYLRNICMCLDAHYWKDVPEKAMYSTVA